MENCQETAKIFCRFISLNSETIPLELEKYLEYVAKTGKIVYNWLYLKHLLKVKLQNVLKYLSKKLETHTVEDNFNFEEMKSTLIDGLENYSEPPLSLQRIVQLLREPLQDYNRVDFYMRALHKNLTLGKIIDISRSPTTKFTLERKRDIIELPCVTNLNEMLKIKVGKNRRCHDKHYVEYLELLTEEDENCTDEARKKRQKRFFEALADYTQKKEARSKKFPSKPKDNRENKANSN